MSLDCHYIAVGIRRKKKNQTLDVGYPIIFDIPKPFSEILGELEKKWGFSGKNSFATIKNIEKFSPNATMQRFSDCIQEEPCLDTKEEKLLHFLLNCGIFENNNVDCQAINDLPPQNVENERAIRTLISFLAQQKQYNPDKKAKNNLNLENIYAEKDIIIFQSKTLDDPIQSVEEAYFKLHLLSKRLRKPHSLNLEGIFSILPNVAWTNFGPILVEDLEKFRLAINIYHEAASLKVNHVDKFPYLVDYFVPEGVRIVEGSHVRLGAHLGAGTTVMPAGFVNFNAGTLGKAMVEGRISAGVVVGHESDLGGGASVMGTLSGGGKEVISIGDQCLIGANAGVGISLGFGCVVEAGLYITAAAKINLFNQHHHPMDLDENVVELGKNVFKAHLLSGREKMLYYRDSLEGKIICKINTKKIALNPTLHTQQ